jgi:hypothetical protein
MGSLPLPVWRLVGLLPDRVKLPELLFLVALPVL